MIWLKNSTTSKVSRMSKSLETKFRKKNLQKTPEVENKSSTPTRWPLGQLLEEKVLRGQVQAQAELSNSPKTQLMVSLSLRSCHHQVDQVRAQVPEDLALYHHHHVI